MSNPDAYSMNRSITRHTLALSGIITVALCAASPIIAAETSEASTAMAWDRVDLDMVPVIPVVKADRMIIEAVLRNMSDSPFRYFDGNQAGHPVGNLHIVLTKDGKEVPFTVELTPPAATRASVRTLAPGQELSYHIELQYYGIAGKEGDLPPGRYELWARYSVGKHAWFVEEMEVTPAQIDQLVAIIDLVDGPNSASLGLIGGAVGLTIGFLVAAFIFLGHRLSAHGFLGTVRHALHLRRRDRGAT